MRARALQRLGHAVKILNLNECHPENIWARRINNWTGYRLMQQKVGNFISKRVSTEHYDVAWVDSGPMVGSSIIELLHNSALKVVNYNNDDPTGGRDGRAWDTFKAAISSYDLLVTVRRDTESELKKLGARRVLRVWMSCDEVEHQQREITLADRTIWGSDVVFVGSWMPERGEFMAALLRSKIPLAIYGNFWNKAAQWTEIKQAWRGPAIYGDDYAKAIQCSKIALGLLSRGNRDKHTQRTAEIPALGALLCAERTDEHLDLFLEGKEAFFWNDVNECARTCSELLADEDRRRTVAKAGARVIAERGLRNEVILSTILREL